MEFSYSAAYFPLALSPIVIILHIINSAVAQEEKTFLADRRRRMGWLANWFSKDPPPTVIAIDDSNFRTEVLECDIPVLLDVWSSSCAPCARLEPVIIELARRYYKRIKVAEFNTERGPRTLGSLNVMSTPTVIYFSQGREMERIVGFRGQLYHQDYIDNELLPQVNPLVTKKSSSAAGDNPQR
jgi:thioredoxin 1